MNRKISVPLTSISITKDNGILNGTCTHEKEFQIERSQTVYFEVEFPNGELTLPANSLNLLIYDQNQTDISHKYEHCIVYHPSNTQPFENIVTVEHKTLWSYFIKSDVEITYGAEEKVLKGLLCELTNNSLILLVDGTIVQLDISKINSLTPLEDEKLQLYLNNTTRRSDRFDGFTVFLNEKEDKFNYQSNNHSSTIKIVFSYPRILNQSNIYSYLKLKENSVMEVSNFLSFRVFQQFISNVKIIYEENESFIPYASANQTVVVHLSTFSIKYFLRTIIGKAILSELRINNTSSHSLDSIVLMKDKITSSIRLQGGPIAPNEEISIGVNFDNCLTSEHDKESNQEKHYFVNVAEFPIQIVDILKAQEKDEIILLPKEKYCFKTSAQKVFGLIESTPNTIETFGFAPSNPIFNVGIAKGEENINPILKNVTFEEIRWDCLSGNSNFTTTFGSFLNAPLSSINTAGDCTAGTFGFGFLNSTRNPLDCGFTVPSTFIERGRCDDDLTYTNNTPSPPTLINDQLANVGPRPTFGLISGPHPSSNQSENPTVSPFAFSGIGSRTPIPSPMPPPTSHSIFSQQPPVPTPAPTSSLFSQQPPVPSSAPTSHSFFSQPPVPSPIPTSSKSLFSQSPPVPSPAPTSSPSSSSTSSFFGSQPTHHPTSSPAPTSTPFSGFSFGITSPTSTPTSTGFTSQPAPTPSPPAPSPTPTFPFGSQPTPQPAPTPSAPSPTPTFSFGSQPTPQPAPTPPPSTPSSTPFSFGSLATAQLTPSVAPFQFGATPSSTSTPPTLGSGIAKGSPDRSDD